MGTFPAGLTYTGTELNVDQPAKSSQIQKSRDREQLLLDGLTDGAAAPAPLNNLDVNNLTVSGTLTATGGPTFSFPERALIFSAF